jgi:hypothetical protein
VTGVFVLRFARIDRTQIIDTAISRRPHRKNPYGRAGMTSIIARAILHLGRFVKARRDAWQAMALSQDV